MPTVNISVFIFKSVILWHKCIKYHMKSPGIVEISKFDYIIIGIISLSGREQDFKK